MPRPEWRDPAKERYWRRVLGQWRRSGLTAREFCAEHGLSEPSFYAWRREIGRRDQERTAGTQATPAVSASRRSAAAALPAFVPVRIEASAACALEVVVAGGRLLRVRPGFDAEVLRHLLAVLEEPPC
jgi:transposase-like protein